MTEKRKLKEIKRAIQYIEIARRSGYSIFHAMLDSERFDSEVIKPLEEISDWNEEDEKEVNRLTEEFKKRTEVAKTLKEKSEILKKILKIGAVGGGIAVGTGAISAVAVHFLKKSKDK